MATVEAGAMPQIEVIVTTTGGRIPKLCNGDHLTRAEFERRYTAMPEIKKAELIKGVVYMPSPVSLQHCDPHFDMVGWLCFYRAATPGVVGGDNGTVRLDEESEPQPDAMLRIRPEQGGQTRVEDGYVAGPPELVTEVAASSASYDLHEKLDAYQGNGVREYVVWRVWDAAIDWFVLREGRFEKQAPDVSGLLKSKVFPGLWLDPAAMLRGDLARVMAVVQQGIASPEHAAFVEKLSPTAPLPPARPSTPAG